MCFVGNYPILIKRNETSRVQAGHASSENVSVNYVQYINLINHNTAFVCVLRSCLPHQSPKQLTNGRWHSGRLPPASTRAENSPGPGDAAVSRPSWLTPGGDEDQGSHMARFPSLDILPRRPLCSLATCLDFRTSASPPLVAAAPAGLADVWGARRDDGRAGRAPEPCPACPQHGARGPNPRGQSRALG